MLKLSDIKIGAQVVQDTTQLVCSIERLDLCVPGPTGKWIPGVMFKEITADERYVVSLTEFVSTFRVKKDQP